MNQRNAIKTGAIVGLLLGITAVFIITAAWILFAQQFSVGRNWGHLLLTFVIPFGIGNGLLLGSLCGALSSHFSCRELAILGVLLSIATGALSVMAGNFSNTAVTPAILYFLAIGNGLLISPVAAFFSQRQVIT